VHNTAYGAYVPFWPTLHIPLSNSTKSRFQANAFNSCNVRGCAELGQLLVWEWRSDSYVLKQMARCTLTHTHTHTPVHCLHAVGCAKLGQLLVWEWRSDSYVLKQQGHYHDIATTAFSPDGALVATGSDDRKVRVCVCVCDDRKLCMM